MVLMVLDAISLYFIMYSGFLSTLPLVRNGDVSIVLVIWCTPFPVQKEQVPRDEADCRENSNS